MESTKDFLERLRTALDKGSRVTDYELAKEIGVSTGGMANYMNHGRTMDDEVAIRVAKKLNIKAAYVMACCHAERAKTIEATNIWISIANEHAA